MAGLVSTAMGAPTMLDPTKGAMQTNSQPASTSNSISPDAVPNSPGFTGQSYSGQDFTQNTNNTPTFDSSKTYTPPSTPNAAGYQPAQQNVDPSKQLVQNQLSDVLSSGSPLIDSAKANVASEYNARGLVNSSMEAGSSTNAALQTALPIAQANAQEYSHVADANQNATNMEQQQQTAGQQSEQIAQTQGAITSAQSSQNATQTARINAISQSISSALQGQTATEASGKSAQDATQSAVMDTFHTMLSSQQQQVIGSSSAASSVVQSLQSQIGAILADPNIAQADKSGLISHLMDSAQNSITAIGSIMNLDFSQLLGGAQAQAPAGGAAVPTSGVAGRPPTPKPLIRA